jgi:uncharacterized membrane protein YagU involved in acid resistance
MAVKTASIKRTLSPATEEKGLFKSKPTLRVLLAGIVGSLAMAGVFYVAPQFGLPRLSLFGTMSTVSSSDFQWMAPLQFLSLSIIVFPLLYAKLMYENLSGKPWQRGLFWGLTLWFLRAVIVMPVMGEGLFSMSGPNPLAMNMVTLAGHAIYGLLLGLIAGDQSQFRHRYVHRSSAINSRHR